MIQQKRGSQFNLGCGLIIIVSIVILVFAVWQQFTSNPPVKPTTVSALSVVQATMPARLTSRDVLPTLTPDTTAVLRQIIFPGVGTTSLIVPSIRNGDSWETRYLGDSVGLLQGTSWLNDPGGNIVLIGHVEDAEGRPGPFANLFTAKVGDVVILRNGNQSVTFKVSSVERASPDDMRYVVQNGKRRITMITCSDWEPKSRTYLARMVVVALPIT